jgi:chorismate-pyruvate lyase
MTIQNLRYLFIAIALICTACSSSTETTTASLWQTSLDKIPEKPPIALGSWLIDPSSMTAKLTHKDGSLYLQVLACEKASILDSEARALHLPINSIEDVRRVVLGGEPGKPWIYGSTLFTKETTAHYGDLCQGLNPVGHSLFTPSTKIGNFEFAYISPDSAEYKKMIAALSQADVLKDGLPKNNLWARRRIFYFEEKYPLMVTEIFLPNHPGYTNYQ